MSDTVQLIKPRSLDRNPDNPRLVFHQDELDALEESIKMQGILVPLTVYREGTTYKLLDGERRWRCSIKLGLPVVPVIVQPKPTKLQNLMMMFAIHHRRNEWDPLPTALKLRDLDLMFTGMHGKRPTEVQLAELASLTRGEVRRLRKLLSLPNEYIKELMAELDLPRSQQILKVDHVIEATAAAGRLRAENVVDESGEARLRRAIVDKLRSGVINNTTAPRKLAGLARGVSRGEVPMSEARAVVKKLIDDPDYGVEDAYSASVAEVEFQHSSEQLIDRLANKLSEFASRKVIPSSEVVDSLKQLKRQIEAILRG